MTDLRVKRLAAELQGIKQQITALSTTPQLASSSIEDGAVESYDRDGRLRMVVGQQHDGTHASNVVSGPIPDPPAGLTAQGGQLTAQVSWDGSWAGGGVAPMDLARVEAHVTAGSVVLPDAMPGSLTRVGTIETAAGASVTFQCVPGERWVWLVARSQAGKTSEPCGPVKIIVQGAVDPAIFEQAKQDLADAQTRLDATKVALDQARKDLYDKGGKVDVLSTTLTGKVDAASTNAAQAVTVSQEAASTSQDAWNKALEAEEAAKNQAAVVRIDSSRGLLFKSNQIATVLSVTVFRGDKAIEDILALRAEYGPGAYIEWQWQRMNEQAFGVISSADSRISRGGFALTISPAEVDEKTTFRAVVNGGN